MVCIVWCKWHAFGMSFLEFIQFDLSFFRWGFLSPVTEIIQLCRKLTPPPKLSIFLFLNIQSAMLEVSLKYTLLCLSCDQSCNRLITHITTICFSLHWFFVSSVIFLKHFFLNIGMLKLKQNEPKHLLIPHSQLGKNSRS